MIVVIFELQPLPGQEEHYFSAAQALQSLVDNVDGFISVERFQSVSQPGKYLSLSYWRDEKAVADWRKNDQHRQAQALGRREIFENYRLRIAQVVRDYGMHDRVQAPQLPLAAPLLVEQCDD